MSYRILTYNSELHPEFNAYFDNETGLISFLGECFYNKKSQYYKNKYWRDTFLVEDTHNNWLVSKKSGFKSPILTVQTIKLNELLLNKELLFQKQSMNLVLPDEVILCKTPTEMLTKDIDFLWFGKHLGTMLTHITREKIDVIVNKRRFTYTDISNTYIESNEILTLKQKDFIYEKMQKSIKNNLFNFVWIDDTNCSTIGPLDEYLFEHQPQLFSQWELDAWKNYKLSSFAYPDIYNRVHADDSKVVQCHTLHDVYYLALQETDIKNKSKDDSIQFIINYKNSIPEDVLTTYYEEDIFAQRKNIILDYDNNADWDWVQHVVTESNNSNQLYLILDYFAQLFDLQWAFNIQNGNQLNITFKRDN